MRILHTSDWHLGQHFFGKSREQEHRALIDWLVEQVAQQRVDAVLLAGDVFDTGAPPSYARELYHRLVLNLHDVGAQLVVIGGNHDSVAVLGESRDLLTRLTTHVVPGVTLNLHDQVVVLPQRNGEPGAIVCVVPFIRPREVLQSHAGETAQEKQQSLQQAIAHHYLSVFKLAVQHREALGLPLPIVATGHLATVGASSSESVREIYIGTLDALPVNALPPADYVALGHIHRPQQVGSNPHIRYCGSPLALSFDELGQAKQVLLVDFAAGSKPAINALPVPQFQPMHSLSGSLADLQRQIDVLARQLAPQQSLWLELEVGGSDGLLNDLPARVATLVAEWPMVEVLRIRRERKQAMAGLQSDARQTLAELQPEQVFEQVLIMRDRDGQLDEPTRQQLRSLYRQVLADVQEVAQ